MASGIWGSGGRGPLLRGGPCRASRLVRRYSQCKSMGMAVPGLWLAIRRMVATTLVVKKCILMPPGWYQYLNSIVGPKEGSQGIICV